MKPIAVLAVLGLSACSIDRATEPAGSSRVPLAANAARTATLTPVSLVVTVSDTDSLGGAYGIHSDGQGAYVDGTQSVQASIDKYGTFAFNTNTSTRKAATRWVRYDFDHPVDPNNTYRPSPTNDNNYHFSTGASSFSQWVPLQNLGVGGNPATQCGYMGNGISNSTQSWKVSFHKGLDDVSDGPTAYAVFTRISTSPAVWTVEPVGSCSPASNVAALRDASTNQLYGYYTIPFHFTLTAK